MLGIELTPEHDLDRLVDLGVRAERAGYDAVYATCHYNNRDPWAFLSRLAAATDDVRLGPGVANPLETHPVTLASKLATLDEASDGRAVFGVGPGDPSTLRNLGMADRRGLRPVLEAFKAAQRLWAGERVDHEGTFDADGAGLNYEPPQGDGLPVHVGGEGPHMCRMAAKHADGLLYNGSHPADLRWAREQVADGLDDRPADRGGFDLIAYAAVSVDADGEAAREAARPPVAFIAAGAAPPVLDRHGIDPDAATAIGDRVSAGEFSAAFERVTPDMIDAFSMAGTPEAVRERAIAVAEHADGLVVGSPLGPDLEASVDLAADALDGVF
ncbi:5,10-methylenetetrahydromethanopterin reductase [Halorubrum sp. JWXQ-INN 858]|uniref:5,10-methylenetetrahydromethanopterin reductase n=1 Tax=Halorubrum sp. JWXQ-INN 858 TaxID=2690782 RepID=UPI00135A50F0|nr:5,10-methylenetetrahydromethanopterin reductase [Halorubrum sp. JWXQ-INN 858]MWV64611.1 5,10-methylenetetrahydromethanopterin reductase [Halorubrum sp. JWXQ-INN 858]